MATRWKRWKDQHPDQERAARRFRHHVRTAWNPKGRIYREPCFSCAHESSQAHHPDHAHPFRVVWVCNECHRDLEDGRLSFGKRDVWDYTSLVVTRPKLHRVGPRQRRAPREQAA
jgi:hypothetical protein